MPEYPLLQRLVNKIDDNSIKTIQNVEFHCINKEPVAINYNFPHFISAADYVQNNSFEYAISLFRESNNFGYCNLYTCYGSINSFRRLALDNELSNSSIVWKTDENGFWGIAESTTIGDSDNLFRVIRLTQDGQIQKGNSGPYPGIVLQHANGELIATQNKTEIGRVSFQQRDRKYTTHTSRWSFGTSSQGCCFYLTNRNPDIDQPATVLKDFIIKTYSVRLSNGKLSLHQIADIDSTMLSQITGGGFGVEPQDIHVVMPPAYYVDKDIAYLTIHYKYHLANEDIIVSSCLRVLESGYQLADYSIAYRNQDNPILNVNLCRGVSGSFTLLPSSTDPPLYKPDVTSNDELCVLNDGRLWLLKSK